MIRRSPWNSSRSVGFSAVRYEGACALAFASLLASFACGSDDGNGSGSAAGAPFGNGSQNSPSTVVAQPNLPAPSATDPAATDPAAMDPAAVGATPSNEQPQGDIALTGIPAPSTATAPATPATEPPATAIPVENSGSACTIPALPGFNQLPAIASLPRSPRRCSSSSWGRSRPSRAS